MDLTDIGISRNETLAIDLTNAGGWGKKDHSFGRKYYFFSEVSWERKPSCELVKT